MSILEYDAEKHLAFEREEGKAEGIINTMYALNATQEQIVAQLISQMGLSEAEALKLLEEK